MIKYTLAFAVLTILFAFGTVLQESVRAPTTEIQFAAAWGIKPV